MHITVEIGTTEEQKTITKELLVLEHICGLFDPRLALQEVIVALDFDGTVNCKQGTNTYKSERSSHVSVAKLIRVQDEYVLVLSPILFDEKYDALCRTFFFLHEIVHIYDWQNSPRLSGCENIPPHYIGDMYVIFGEYCADRKAYKIIDSLFPERSAIYQQFVVEMLSGHVATMIDDVQFYNVIQQEIMSFRLHGDVQRFIENIREPYYEVAMAMAHAYAGLDHFSSFAEIEQKLRASRFHDEKTIQLMSFIRAKYAENNMNLLDGIPFMEDFMTNFGIRFEILPSGELYCHVLDI
jgi:hypothetical protein